MKRKTEKKCISGINSDIKMTGVSGGEIKNIVPYADVRLEWTTPYCCEGKV